MLKYICIATIITKVTSYEQPYYMPYYTPDIRPGREIQPYVIEPRVYPAYPPYSYKTPEPIPNPTYTYKTPELIPNPTYTYKSPEPMPNPTYTYKVPEPINYPTPIVENTQSNRIIIDVPNNLKPVEEKDEIDIGDLYADIINNLAIALQLLILHNLNSNPFPELEKLKSGFKKSEELIMPNSKFLGTTSFGEMGMGMGLGNVPLSSPRANMMLKSPYDAIATNTLPTSSLKSDFVSPYAAIMANDDRELFTTNELFL